MAILYGTTSGGDVLPVQVDQAGRLVAEGLDGPTGPAGPEGPAGPAGPAGAGVPLPLGTEGQVIQIVNGVAVWQDYTPYVPPVINEIQLLDTRDVVPPNTYQWGAFDDSAASVSPPDPWDTFIRALPTWDNPTAKRTGIGSRGVPPSPKLTIDFPLSLNISGSYGKILELTFAFDYTFLDNPEGKAWIDITSNQSDLVSIYDQYSNTWNVAEALVTFQFLINRPDIGDVTFDLSCYFTGTNFSSSNWGYLVLQKFEAVESTFMIDMMRRQAQLEAQAKLARS